MCLDSNVAFPSTHDNCCWVMRGSTVLSWGYDFNRKCAMFSKITSGCPQCMQQLLGGDRIRSLLHKSSHKVAVQAKPEMIRLEEAGWAICKRLRPRVFTQSGVLQGWVVPLKFLGLEKTMTTGWDSQATKLLRRSFPQLSLEASRLPTNFQATCANSFIRCWRLSIWNVLGWGKSLKHAATSSLCWNQPKSILSISSSKIAIITRLNMLQPLLAHGRSTMCTHIGSNRAKCNWTSLGLPGTAKTKKPPGWLSFNRIKAIQHLAPILWPKILEREATLFRSLLACQAQIETLCCWSTGRRSMKRAIVGTFMNGLLLKWLDVRGNELRNLFSTLDWVWNRS